jgi:hypothetical protein
LKNKKANRSGAGGGGGALDSLHEAFKPDLKQTRVANCHVLQLLVFFS